jgi:hypothetical protein
MIKYGIVNGEEDEDPKKAEKIASLREAFDAVYNAPSVTRQILPPREVPDAGEDEEGEES